MQGKQLSAEPTTVLALQFCKADKEINKSRLQSSAQAGNEVTGIYIAHDPRAGTAPWDHLASRPFSQKGGSRWQAWWVPNALQQVRGPAKRGPKAPGLTHTSPAAPRSRAEDITNSKNLKKNKYRQRKTKKQLKKKMACFSSLIGFF